jgi:hypothetical protein
VLSIPLLPASFLTSPADHRSSSRPVRILALVVGLPLLLTCQDQPTSLTPPEEFTVEFLQESLTLDLGTAIQLDVSVTGPSGRRVSDPEVTWTSTRLSVASVYPQGLVRGRAVGLAWVSAQVEDATASIRVEVVPIAGQNRLVIGDSAQLASDLETISQSWNPSAEASANRIFTEGSYSSSDWETFFRGFFASHDLTNRLVRYLKKPLFTLLPQEAMQRLQKGVFPSVLENTSALLRGYGLALPEAVALSPHLAEVVQASCLLLSEFGTHSREASIQESLAGFYESLLSAFPDFFLGPVMEERSMRRVSAMVYMGLLTAQPLDAVREAELRDLFGLEGIRAEILERHGVLVLDAYLGDGGPGRLDGPQMAVIDHLLSAVPRDNDDLRAITVLDAFGLFPGYFHCCFATRYAGHSLFSIHASPSGQSRNNPFPSDGPDRLTPAFNSVLVHEYNHIVDFVLSEESPEYLTRRGQLIAQAGADTLNYLRSMIRSGFFLESPRELLSSTAQQWFVDSEGTVGLGLDRFEKGWREPINQALWIAEVYSMGGDSTLFYSLSGATLEAVRVPLTRDSHGNIATLAVNGRVYSFVRDLNGNVEAFLVV